MTASLTTANSKTSSHVNYRYMSKSDCSCKDGCNGWLKSCFQKIVTVAKDFSVTPEIKGIKVMLT